MPELTPGQRLMVEDGLPAGSILDPADRKEAWKGRKLTKPRDLKAPAKDEDPATRALRKEIAAADAKKKAERLARLKDLKPKPAKQETDMATKKTPAKKAAPKAAKKPAGKPAAKKAPKAPAAPKATPAASPGRPDGLRPGSKQAMMLDMALRPNGASEAEICQALDWKKCRVTLKRTAEKVGATLTTSKHDGVTIFKATLPAGA